MVLDISVLKTFQVRIGEKALKSVKAPRISKSSIRYVCGLDVSYSRKVGGVAAAAVFEVGSGKLVDVGLAVGEPAIEYVPGLLAFREAPLLYTAFMKLLEEVRNIVDVVLVDGHGIAHPRYSGIATHIGLALGMPALGVAKRKLYGRIVPEERPCSEFPCVVGWIEDRRNPSLLLGAVLSSDTGSKLYVSPGAYVDLKTAVEIVMRVTSRGHKLPLPIYYADGLSRSVARALDSGTLSIESIADYVRNTIAKQSRLFS
ncbi:MAG: endonuclease V [Thermoproteota archaeon]